MKVLFFTFWYPSINKPQLGIFIREQAIALATVGVEVTVVHINVQKGSGLLDQSCQTIDDEGTKLVRLSFTGKLWNWFYNIPPWQLRAVSNRLKETGVDAGSFDVIHSHVVHPASALAHRLFKDLNKPHVISEHWSGVKDHLKDHPFAGWAKRAYENTDMILVVSQYLKKNLKKLLPENAHIKVVPNVVSSNEFNYEPDQRVDAFEVVMVSNWNQGRRQIKRPELVIEAIGQVQVGVDKPLVLTLIGDGDRIPELQLLAEQHEVTLNCLGHLAKSEIAARFQQASLLAHASNFETFCIVIAEAHKCGLPVVASNVGAIPELINERNGILVNNSVESWKAGLMEGLQTRFDRTEIATSAAPKFSPKEVGEQLLNTYITLNK